MSDTYKFKVRGTCAGGEHITIDILRNGSAYKTRVFSREDIATGEYQTWDKISSLLIAKIIKGSGATTDAEYISAIESTEIKL